MEGRRHSAGGEDDDDPDVKEQKKKDGARIIIKQMGPLVCDKINKDYKINFTTGLR